MSAEHVIMPMPRSFTDEELLEVWDECSNLSEVVEKLYGNKGGGYFPTVKRAARKNDLDVDAKRGNPGKHARKPVNELCNGGNIRKALLRSRGRECENCGRNKWLSNDIPLELHRIDDSKTYEECNEEDLKLLCPNCHKLTDNWGAKKV